MYLKRNIGNLGLDNIVLEKMRKTKSYDLVFCYSVTKLISRDAREVVPYGGDRIHAEGVYGIESPEMPHGFAALAVVIEAIKILFTSTHLSRIVLS